LQEKKEEKKKSPRIPRESHRRRFKDVGRGVAMVTPNQFTVKSITDKRRKEKEALVVISYCCVSN